MRRPWFRVRVAHELEQQRRLQACEVYRDAEICYLWGHGDVPDGDTVRWLGPGYYWHPGSSDLWTAIGLGRTAARRWVTSKLRVEGALRRPPTFDEVVDVITAVVGVAGVLVPVVDDAVDIARGGKVEP